MRVLLDHSIVGIDTTAFTFRKDRPFAGCCICGALFQPAWMSCASDIQYAVDKQRLVDGEYEIKEWRAKHNSNHTAREHLAYAQSGLAFTPEAARRLAPYGLVPIGDADQPEIAQALLEADRAPSDDVESTLKGWR